MAKRDALRDALIAGDVDLLQRMWATWFPHAYRPQNWQEAEIQLHLARTKAQNVPLRLRCYSHHWLIERELPSMLPDDLKPKAESYRPKIASAVGFAWGTHSKIMKPAEPIIVRAVSDRIEEMALDGMLESNPDGVRTEMLLTKNRVLHKLFGNIASLLKETKHARVRTA